MKAIICGGREYHLGEPERRWLNLLHQEHRFTVIITGGAAGADFGGAEWAKEAGIESVVMPADWNKHGRGAGPIRNQQMLNAAGPGSLVIAFPGGRGTAHMVRIAQQAGRKILQFKE